MNHLPVAISSAITSANNGGLSKYELQRLGEFYPDLFAVFALIDDLQDRETSLEERAAEVADEDSKERAKVIQRIEGHRTDLASHLDNIDSAIVDETDIDLDGFREALTEARNSMNAIETECDEAPE